MFLEVLELVLKRNIFQFGDTFWRQMVGTAMGTSTACKLATLYFGFHERTVIIPRYSQFLLYFKRFIDDVMSVWDTGKEGSAQAWTEFQADLNNFGRLKWTVEPLGYEVNFLDLTVSIGENRRIKTKTFQKPLNLHLYIPPSSAHPPGMLRGLIFGTLRRFWTQNTNINDYRNITTKFAGHLMDRGYKREEIAPLFQEISNRLDEEASKGGPKTQPNKSSPGKSLFYHVEFHPHDIGRRAIRAAFDRHLKAATDFDRFVVAFHRPKNLRDELTRTRLPEDGDYVASTYRP